MFNSAYSCPSCGAGVALRFRYSKITTCQHCQASLFLEDDAMKLRGKAAVMADYPSLIQLNTPFLYKTMQFEPIGHARFAYAHGFWDEWWVINPAGQGKWLSVDEGDYALEIPTPVNNPQLNFDQLTLGKKVSLAGERLLVSEIGQAECTGMAGELPEVIQIGDRFRYAHLSGVRQTLYTLEEQNGQLSLYKGAWLDVFAIRAMPAMDTLR